MTDMHRIGVIGLGAMGLGIAQVFAQAGHEVIVTDSSAQARETALSRMAALLDALVKSGKLTGDEREAVLSRIRVVDQYDAFGAADLVIEAIVEVLDVKQSTLLALEPHLDAGCVIATNTSSLSVARIMQGLSAPQRGIGLHFFNPVAVMKLVELIAPPGVSQAALDLAETLVTSINKQVVRCDDRPGFIVNRCARPFYGEALAMFEEGRQADEIDAAMQQAGYRLGPFSLIDLVGADINLAATESLKRAMADHPRYHVFEALKAQVASGKLGRKTGQGFIFPHGPGATPVDADDIVLRIEAVMANEAASLISEGRVSAAQLDLAMKLGLNFPRGPIESARRWGMARVLETLARLERDAPQWLKGRYQAVPILGSLS